MSVDPRPTLLHRSERQFVRRLLILALFIAAGAALWRVRDVLLLAFGSVILAVLLHAVADPLSRRAGISNGVALAATVALLFVILGLAGWSFGSEVGIQLAYLGDVVPEAWRSTEAQLRGTLIGRHLLDWLGTSIGKGFSEAGYLVISLGSALAGVLAMVVGGIYFASQPDLYRRGLLKLVPAPGRPLAAETVAACGGALKLWLVGQLVAMLFVGLLTGLGAAAIGLPSPMALGLLAGLLEFVPYAGPILMAVPALLLAATLGTEQLVLTLALMIGIQQVEGYVITPLIQRRAVSLPPALTLFALIAMGLLFGVMGVVLAAPLTVVFYVALKELYVRHLLGEETSVPGEQHPPE